MLGNRMRNPGDLSPTEGRRPPNCSKRSNARRAEHITVTVEGESAQVVGSNV